MARRTTGGNAMDNNKHRVSSLCDRINAASKNDDNETVFEALIIMFTYRMSLGSCDHYREAAAQHLTESIPEMLANANREAARRVAGDMAAYRAPIERTHH
jgi:hypothetical protein